MVSDRRMVISPVFGYDPGDWFGSAVALEWGRPADKRPQAPRHGRYRRASARAPRQSRRRPGPQRSRVAAQDLAPPPSFVERAYADSAYNSPRVAGATIITIEIVRKIADQVGFVVHPRRWVVERSFAWLGRNRRMSRDFEATIASAKAFIYAASAMLLVRRLARSA